MKSGRHRPGRRRARRGPGSPARKETARVPDHDVEGREQVAAERRRLAVPERDAAAGARQRRRVVGGLEGFAAVVVDQQHLRSAADRRVADPAIGGATALTVDEQVQAAAAGGGGLDDQVVDGPLAGRERYLEWIAAPRAAREVGLPVAWQVGRIDAEIVGVRRFAHVEQREIAEHVAALDHGGALTQGVVAESVVAGGQAVAGLQHRLVAVALHEGDDAHVGRVPVGIHLEVGGVRLHLTGGVDRNGHLSGQAAQHVVLGEPRVDEAILHHGDPQEVPADVGDVRLERHPHSGEGTAAVVVVRNRQRPGRRLGDLCLDDRRVQRAVADILATAEWPRDAVPD